MRTLLVLAGCVTACLAVGMVGSAVTQPGLRPWYAELTKPPLTPPNAVFGPAWGVLFIAMGVALTLVVLAPAGPARTLALSLFGVQLALNVAWSWIFFGNQAPGWALVEIVVFLAAVVATALACYRVAPAAGWLFVPYILWVCFATYLNAGIWLLNRD